VKEHLFIILRLRKYHEVINLPEEADVKTAKSVFNNGILEITFNKKTQSEPKGRE
jgi:HSP20 family protein